MNPIIAAVRRQRAWQESERLCLIEDRRIIERKIEDCLKEIHRLDCHLEQAKREQARRAISG